MSSKLRVQWEGSFHDPFPHAYINRRIALELTKAASLDLSCKSEDRLGDSGNSEIKEITSGIPCENPQICVYHSGFPKLKPPVSGQWVIMQPWEFGSLYREWLLYFRHLADEVWVYSNYNRNCYLEDGIAEERVKVIPLGVDPEIFKIDRTEGGKNLVNTKKKYKFLYVGSLVFRKGIDVLLDAYTNAFSNKDNVVLAIKSGDAAGLLESQGTLDRIKAIAEDPNAPEIVYMKEVLQEPEMSGLYNECDCLVHPYRSEGFGLTVAEAMACGLPVILTKGGACDDFTSKETAIYLTKVNKRIIEPKKVTVREPWLLEPDPTELSEKMKNTIEHQEKYLEMGRMASHFIRQNFTWEKTAEAVLNRINARQDKMPARHFFPVGMGEVKPEEMFAKARELLEANDLERASHLYLELNEKYPDKLDTVSGLGLVAWYHERFEEAQRWFAEGLKINGIDEDTLFNFCDASLKLNQPQSAEFALKRALKMKPSLTEAARYLERLHQEKQRRDVVRFDKVVAQREIVKQGELLLKEGMVDKAEEVFDSILEVDPEDFEAMCDKGIICYYREDHETAYHWITKSLKIAPTVQDTLVNLFDVALKLRKVDKIIPVLREAVRLRPELADVSAILAEVERKGDDIYCLDNYNDIDPTEELFRTAKSHLDSAELGRASTCFLEVIDKKPDHDGAFTGLGVVAYHRNSYEDAFTLFRQAVAINPLNVDAVLNLYDVSKKVGREAEVRPYLENIAEVEEDPAIKTALSESP